MKSLEKEEVMRFIQIFSWHPRCEWFLVIVHFLSTSPTGFSGSSLAPEKAENGEPVYEDENVVALFGTMNDCMCCGEILRYDKLLEIEYVLKSDYHVFRSFRCSVLFRTSA